MYVLEYIWLDSDNEFRSKTKVIHQDSIISFPIWNYDGSSTGQAIGTDSEIFLKPVAEFKDPFRSNESDDIKYYLVLCETFDKTGKPLNNNYRSNAVETHNKYEEHQPWFGLEQEYFILDYETKLPLGFVSKNNQPKPQAKYYCGIGTGRALGRNLAEKHLELCLKTGIKISGINAEVAPGQWEFQVGPLSTVSVGDHLMMARYLLVRLAEDYGYCISFHPKPLGKDADWNGSGCHVNFSTNKMRDTNGIEEINHAVSNLEFYHNLHMRDYGKDNEQRLSGKHETSSMHKFTTGRGNRGASIRIPNETINNGCGYFEDRRPAANIDPYLVCSLILQAVNDEENMRAKSCIDKIDYII